MDTLQISIAGGGKPYAGFWRRVFAALIDSVILMIVMSPVLIAGGFFEIMAMDPEYIAMHPEAAMLPPWTGIVGGLIGLTYKLLFEATGLRATPGKLALGLRVTDLAGEKLSVGAAAIRSWPWWAGSLLVALDSLAGTGQILSNSIGFAGVLSFLVCAFTPHKQGVHDMMARALVVRKGAEFAGTPVAA